MFENSYKKLINNFEGNTWTNDKDDQGGETYKGISRVYHPDWEGWIDIDSYKSQEDFPKNLKFAGPVLEMKVRNFYKINYWDAFLGDNLNDFIADELFEQSVNVGLIRAVCNFQKALNLLNNNGKLYDDIKVDGDLGSFTFNAYQKCILKRGYQLLYNIMNFYQGSFYIKNMEINPKKEKWIGWFKRVEIIKN